MSAYETSPPSDPDHQAEPHGVLVAPCNDPSGIVPDDGLPCHAAARAGRGYAAVGLWQPKDGRNVGGALRAAQVYGAVLVALIGAHRPAVLSRHPTDTMKAHRHIPVVLGADIAAVRPLDCHVVAVEFDARGKTLPEFKHPERALYLFGPEDGSLPAHILAAAEHVVRIPTDALHEPRGDGQRRTLRPARQACAERRAPRSPARCGRG